MSLHFLAAIAGTLVAVAGTGVLASRCLRAPNAALVAWTVALFGLTVALAAQALGFKIGFGPIAFRAMELGAQVVAPLALALGLAELAGKSIVTRFAARLILAALAIVCLVIFGSDPLSAAPFSKAWPAAGVYYQIVPNKLLEYVLAPVTVIIALIAMGFAANRPSRDPAWRDALTAAGAAGVSALLLAVPGVVMLLSLNVPLGSLFVPLCVLAAVGTWFAGAQVGRLALDVLREDVGADYGDEWESRPAWAGGPATGDFDPVDADDEFGIYRSNGSPRQRDDRDYGSADYGEQPGYRGERGYPGGPGYSDSSYPNEAGHLDGPLYRDEAGYRDGAGYPGDGYRDDDDSRLDGPAYLDDDSRVDGPPYLDDDSRVDGPPYRDDDSRVDGPPYRDEAGYPGGAAYPGEARHPLDPGHRDDAGYPGAAAPVAADHDAQANLFGQIAIYTLLEDRVEDFDRLTRRVVRQVRMQEPDTLVYIVHAVPSAPMQRILYEVYRDRAAYETHKRQPYVVAFEADRRPYVLATNIIELGLQQAKVSPLPSVSDLLSDSGFDLLSDSGFGQPGYGPRPSGGVGGVGGVRG
jgi:quinol monooxygenase YgiN